MGDLTDAEWRAFQSIPDQGYSHRAWLDNLVRERMAQAWNESAEATVEWVAATGRPGPNGPIDPPLNPYEQETS